MIQSMTGFGSGRAVAGDEEISVELKSVNHKFCEVKARLPRELAALEVDQLMSVRGEAAGTTATITIVREMHQAVIQKVSDVQLAQELAQRIRTRAAGG